MKFLLLFLFSLSVVVQAENFDEDFEESPVGEVGNEDSDIEVSSGIKQVTYGGTGCPQSSAQVVISEDRKTLSVLFSKFDLEIVPGTTTSLSKDCRVLVDLKVPSNIRATVVRVDDRGFNKLPVAAKSVLRQSYSLVDLTTQQSSRTIFRRKIFQGPVENDFAVASRIKKLQHWSNCGQDFRLDMGVSLKLDNQQRKESALTVLDSADGQLGKRKTQYHLKWKRCQKPHRILKGA